MKIIASLLLLSFVLTGCSLLQRYEMQYSFNNQLPAKQTFEARDQGFYFEIPYQDYSCDLASLKAVINRKQKDLTITVSGGETEQRCKANFTAEVTGVSKGSYSLVVEYKKLDQTVKLLEQAFIIE